jgi:hypothetical protein
LSVELPEPSLRERCVWEELPLDVTFENFGESDGIPVANRLLGGTYREATLVARVRNLAAETASEEEFTLGAHTSSDCGPGGAQLLQPGEVARHAGRLCVRFDLISTGPGTVRDVLVSAFPTAGRYSVRVVYTWAGRSVASAPIEIHVLPVPPHAAGALAALRELGRAGLGIYRHGLMPGALQPKRLDSILRLANDFPSNAYSDLACYALAHQQVGLALYAPDVDVDTRTARLREALDFLERISSPRFSRRAESEVLRGRILERLGR